MAAERRQKRGGRLREAAPCILTIFGFLIPLCLLLCIKVLQLLSLWPTPQ